MPYTKGQSFEFDRAGYTSFGVEELPHKETLTIIGTKESKSIFSFVEDETLYEVTRHFTANKVDTTNTVTMTERELDNIVNRGY